MKKYFILALTFISFSATFGQFIYVDWRKDLSEYKKVSKTLFFEAKENYFKINNINDSINIRKYFEEKDSTLYHFSYKTDTNSITITFTERFDILKDKKSMLIKRSRSKILKFSLNGNLKVYEVFCNGAITYKAQYTNKGYPYIVNSQLHNSLNNNYLMIRYFNKKGDVFSVHSFNNSLNLDRDGLSIMYSTNEKLNYVNYYDQGSLIYSLYYYQCFGKKWYEIFRDSHDTNKTVAYDYNKSGKIRGIVYYDDSYKESLISAISFKRGRIDYEKFADKTIKDKDTGVIIYYDKKHNIKKIEKY